MAVKAKASLSLSSLILIAYIFTVLYTPLTAFSGYRLTRLLPVVWFVVTAISAPNFYSRIGRWEKVLFAFTAYTIVVPFFADVSIISNRYFDLFGMPYFYMAYLYYKDKPNEMKAIITFLVVFSVYTAISSIIVLINDPFAARHGLSSKFEGVGESSNLINFCGNYDYSYMMVLANLCLFYILRYKASAIGIKRSFLFAAFILFTVFIVMTNFLTALICTLVGVLMILFGEKVNVGATFIALIVLGFFFIFKDQILYLLVGFGAQNLGEGLTQSRMESMLGSGGVEDADLYESRSDLYLLGLKGFLSNPVLGNFYTMRYLNDNLYGDISQHSTILDTFSLFGFFIGMAYLYIVYKPLISRYKRTRDSLALSVILVFTALIGFDNASPGLGIAVYFIYMYYYDKIFVKRKIVIQPQTHPRISIE